MVRRARKQQTRRLQLLVGGKAAGLHDVDREYSGSGRGYYSIVGGLLYQIQFTGVVQGIPNARAVASAVMAPATGKLLAWQAFLRTRTGRSSRELPWPCYMRK